MMRKETHRWTSVGKWVKSHQVSRLFSDLESSPKFKTDSRPLRYKNTPTCFTFPITSFHMAGRNYHQCSLRNPEMNSFRKRKIRDFRLRCGNNSLNTGPLDDKLLAGKRKLQERIQSTQCAGVPRAPCPHRCISITSSQVSLLVTLKQPDDEKQLRDGTQ